MDDKALGWNKKLTCQDKEKDIDFWARDDPTSGDPI